MTMFELMVAAVAAGQAKTHNLLQSARANQLMQAGERGALFTKQRPGQFLIELYEGDMQKPVSEENATSPVEAKLSALQWLVDGMKKPAGKRATQQHEDEPLDDEEEEPAPAPRARRR
jgi:hypothetical protein